jgi:Ran GTPase-activating protein (RanGAP) involved in mRNA processing and transport
MQLVFNFVSTFLPLLNHSCFVSTLGIIAIANAIPDMGAISSVNLLQNTIGIAQAKALASILKEHPTLKSLCGNRGNETKLDMSGKKMGASGAIMLAAEIVGNRALLVLSLQSNDLCAAGGKALAEGLKDNQVITELNIACNRLGCKTLDDRHGADTSGVIALADVIPDMGALSSANLLGNKIPVEQAHELVEIMQSKEKLTTLCGLSKEETELDFSRQGFGPGDAVLIANDISGMEALTSLHIGRNNIHERETREMREIMGIAMRMASMKILCEIPFKDKTLTELDVSGKNLGMEGALVVAEYLDGSGAISSVNLLKNAIPVEQAQELVKIMQSKEKLITMCGLSKEETKLDFSNQGLGAGDAVLIANDISDVVGAVTSLNLAFNHLGVEGAKIITAILPKCTYVAL